MKFEVNILGCGSATPSKRHNPSCQVINFRDNLFMVDCGEGSQLMMLKMGLKLSRLSHIFISHGHGDHCFGLPGLLSTMGLHGKGGTVTVHLDEETRAVMEPMIRSFCASDTLNVKFEVIPPGRNKIYEDRSLIVEAFPLYHRIPCHGFIFREKPLEPHINAPMARFHQVPLSMMKELKAGADFVKPDGTIVPNELLTTPATPAVSYAYCSDTLRDARVARSISGVDVVYHESTYADADEHKAHARGHSTAREAAITAREAGARHLILGHYSKSYNDLTPMLRQAQEEMGPRVSLADEGLTFDVRALAGNDAPAREEVREER